MKGSLCEPDSFNDFPDRVRVCTCWIKLSVSHGTKICSIRKTVFFFCGGGLSSPRGVLLRPGRSDSSWRGHFHLYLPEKRKRTNGCYCYFPSSSLAVYSSPLLSSITLCSYSVTSASHRLHTSFFTPKGIRFLSLSLSPCFRHLSDRKATRDGYHHSDHRLWGACPLHFWHQICSRSSPQVGRVHPSFSFILACRVINSGRCAPYARSLAIVGEEPLDMIV